MTVRELLERLREFDNRLDVMVSISDDDEEITEVKLWQDPFFSEIRHVEIHTSWKRK